MATKNPKRCRKTREIPLFRDRGAAGFLFGKRLIVTKVTKVTDSGAFGVTISGELATFAGERWERLFIAAVNTENGR
jgi:hypothetical protein